MDGTADSQKQPELFEQTDDVELSFNLFGCKSLM